MTWQASKHCADFKNMHYNIINAISIEINESIAMNLFYFESKNIYLTHIYIIICIKQLSILVSTATQLL